MRRSVRWVADRPLGFRGIKLKPDDRAISLDVVRADADLFVVTDTGFGKRVKIDRFNAKPRRQGVRAIRLTARAVSSWRRSWFDSTTRCLIASSGGVFDSYFRCERSPRRGTRRHRRARDETWTRVTPVAAVAAVPGRAKRTERPDGSMFDEHRRFIDRSKRARSATTSSHHFSRGEAD